MPPSPAYVSTGHLPAPEWVQAAVAEAYQRFRSVDEGRNAQVYPALTHVAPDLFGICAAGASGAVYVAGDADVPFAIMSVSKPFVFALVVQAIGHERANALIGVNATGLAFDSIEGVERSVDGRTNPMVNAGAIATTTFVPGRSDADRWGAIHEGLSRFAGRDLVVDDDVLRSASETNHRNREIAALLERRDRLGADAGTAVDLYTRQCSLAVTARDLAVMGATLSDGGVNPVSGERVVDPAVCHHTLAAMATAGLYETTGDWLYEIGLPGKSGIGGGIVTVAPGKGGFGTFAPPLDAAGNSVKGQLATAFLARELGLSLFASDPAILPPG
jgi:glutaminase